MLLTTADLERRRNRSPAPPFSDWHAWREYLLRFCVVTASGCWEWQRGRLRSGYGKFKVPGTRNNCLIHRASFIVFHGKISDDQMVCHRCDNPPCCNPDHLFAGTNLDNVRDCISKGRKRTGDKRGENNGRHRLTESDVLNIRELSGYLTQCEIAAIYELAQPQVSAILTGKIWGHVHA